MKRSKLVILVAIVLILSTLTAYLAWLYHTRNKRVIHTPEIYCLMVTGKDEARINYAKLAVQNFLAQTHPYKRLIIVNHHQTLKVLDDNALHIHPYIKEHYMPKTPSTTLGDLRNFSLSHVPIGTLWTIWDDDDYRRDDYLEYLLRHHTSNNIVCFQNRLEHNINTHTSWVAHKKSGYVTLLAPRIASISYLKRDSMEDVNLISDYKNMKYKQTILDNTPNLYLRLVHSNNTSLYVNPKKTYLLNSQHPNAEYYESVPSREENKMIEYILTTFYRVLES